MSIVPNFNTVKCEKCESNGFIIKDGNASICDCR